MSQHMFDIVIAGGGTGGLIIASRLATADPSLSILVVEAGPSTRDDPLHLQPARCFSHLDPETTTIKFHVGRESAALGGRAPVVSCGQCLGGGSSVNFALYNRPAASDYDDWATVYGNRGWSTADLLPLMRKSETYEVAPGRPTHGYSGPLKVSYGGAFTNIGKEFLDVAAQYDKARGSTDDINGLFETNKYGRLPKYIDSKAGTRSDVPHNYIYNKDLKNVHILTGYHVKRVITKDRRATGIEYVPNKRFRPNASPEVVTAMARRLVIVSAGTFGSPGILERSGIGAKQVLEKVGVKQIVDLPGVGENYQDHQVMFAPYVAADDADTLDGIAKGNEAELEKWNAQWERQGNGLMAHNGLDALGKLRPSKHDLDVIGDTFTKRWLEYYVPSPDKPVLYLGTFGFYNGNRATIPVNKGFGVPWYLQHPVSTGHLHITSSDDVEASLDFHPGYLDSPEDIAVHKWGYKMSREYARRMSSYRGEIPGEHPAFSETSQVLARLHDGPVPISDPKLVYTDEDEKAIEDYIRQSVATAWHSLGTCAMKSREKGGVVDSRLNVYGVDRLKVADMSICPGNVAANTYSTAILIGEKAAVLIAEELGIAMDNALPLNPHL